VSVILIVEDVAALREQYAYDLRRLGAHETVEADGVGAALDALARHAIDVVLLDLEMPGADGFALLETLRERGPDVPVIVYTGTGSYDRCVRAVRLGAYGFLDKAEPMERVLQEIANALERHALRREVADLRRTLDTDSPLLGESEAMRTLRSALERIAPIPSPVLVTGESGTGKELVARDLHRLGARPDGPFLAINGAALPESLVESELFGHERGAFTGADRARKGAFEAASGGTLFLDEVGELPLAAQAKLLRVLEDGRVTRVGGSREIATDARVVAATNRDLDAEVAAGRFREDLLYRLNVHVVPVPPLRDRLEDVPLLVAHFLEATARRFGGRAKTADEATLARLAAHDWRRNNVRELRNVVERMVLATDGSTIGADAVPAGIGPAGEAGGPAGASGVGAGAAGEPPPTTGTLRERRDEAERRIVLAALEANDGHLSRTAAELGLADHASLSKVLRRLGIRRS
jgi:DNA-binding NtrC family response regulator